MEEQLNPYSDIALMLKVKSGDSEKLGLLFERYSQPLYGFFFRTVRERQLSEDLTQTVFMRMLTYRHTYTGEGAFTTWMYRIARNVLHDHFRQAERRGPTDPLSDQVAYARAQPEDSEERRVELVKQAMEGLDADKREVLILNRYQGLTYREIGEILGQNESAVKVRAFRAMNELRLRVRELEKSLSL